MKLSVDCVLPTNVHIVLCPRQNAPVPSHLIPSRQKLRIRVSEKPTDISTTKSKPDEVERQQHWNAYPEMIPVACVIPSPHRSYIIHISNVTLKILVSLTAKLTITNIKSQNTKNILMNLSVNQTAHYQINSALHPSGIVKSSTSFGWIKAGNSPLPGGR